MITELRRLWKQAFGDTDTFLDAFFSTGYSPDRCRYLTEEGRVVAMLYWFDCYTQDGRKFAYLYAVATDEAFQNQGLCRHLMAGTHDHLRSLDYAGVLLVPGSADLFRLYNKLGYRTCCYVTEFTCTVGAPVSLRSVDKAEYATLRRKYLPSGGVVQEGASLALLSQFADFYAGDGCVLAVTVEGNKARIHELLGSTDAPGITNTLGCEEGHFRTPGKDKPFAMFYSLDSSPAPTYFGLALD